MLAISQETVFMTVDSFLELLIYFGFNFLVTGFIIRYLYFRKTQRRDYLFTFLMVSTTIFLMVFLLDTVDIQVGFALGLFAIFGILRYRTDTLPVREMTYLFVIIGISVINALSHGAICIAELLLTNFIFTAIAWVLETNHLLRHTSSKVIIYDKLDLINPTFHAQMLEDLKNKTGLEIKRFEIGKIDFKKKVAFVKIFYPGNGHINSADLCTDEIELSEK